MFKNYKKFRYIYLSLRQQANDSSSYFKFALFIEAVIRY